MTHAEIRRLMATADPAGLRCRAGITQQTVADALGTDRKNVADWENGRVPPSGPKGVRYARFIAGLARHEAVTWDRSGGRWLGIREQAA